MIYSILSEGDKVLDNLQNWGSSSVPRLQSSTSKSYGFIEGFRGTPFRSNNLSRGTKPLRIKIVFDLMTFLPPTMSVA